MAMTTFSEDAVARVRRGLAKELENLEKLTPGLGTRVADYIATGEPAGVLDEIAANASSAAALQIGGYSSLHNQDRPIYAELAGAPPVMLLRFAKCLQASGTSVIAAGRTWIPPALIAAAPWLDPLLMHACHCGFGFSGNDPIDSALSAELLAGALAGDGVAPESLIAAAFCTPLRGFGTEGLQRIVRMQGFMELFSRHVEAARPAFAAEDHEQRTHALTALRHVCDESLRHFAAEVAAGLTDGRKTVRVVALPLVRRLGPAGLAPLQQIAVKGDPAQRALALEALWVLGTQGQVAEALDFIRGRKQQEKTKSVLAAIEALELRAGAGAVETGADAQEIPELPALERARMPEAARPAFEQAVATLDETIAKARARVSAEGAAQLPPLEPTYGDALWKYIDGEAGEPPPVPGALRHHYLRYEQLVPFLRFLQIEAVGIGHTLRLHHALGLLVYTQSYDSGRQILNSSPIMAINDRHRVHKRPTLLEVEALLAPFGVDETIIARAYNGPSYTGHGGIGLATDWDGAHVWPFFARHMDIVHRWLRLEMGTGSWYNRSVGFDAVATFPQPPAEVLPRLFELAFGSAKGDRALAQGALAKLPDRQERIVAALSDGKAETRGIAAQWLASLKSAKAVAAVDAALRKEKNDAAIGAMMSALETLGVDVDKYLDRDKLASEAAKGLAKGLPPALSWFNWDGLPEVRWSASALGEGRVIPREVLQWLLVQATKLKSPEPNVLLRRYASKFEASDREALGHFVLDQWLGEEESGGSSIEAKGLLAVAAACGGRETSIAAGRFLKEYYGTRAAHCKALIVMLAWTDHPGATQLMLSVGHRFRTKGIQDEAQTQAELLAERRGWTVADLADRTIPDAGFEDDGTINLAYGAERKFTARMGEGFGLDVFDGDGRKVKALPEPRQGEEFYGGLAKKNLAAAKKDVKTIVALQTDRLYEALCTQRQWIFEDWERYLNRHPVVRRLLQGLVWTQLRDGKVVSTFRPLDDGTLTNVNDEAVTMALDARIGLAHDTNLDAATVAAWRKHMADYEVAAPFPQLGKGAYTLPAELKDKTELADFQGHVLQSFSLRGRATKLGYMRGAAEDGGWFYEYRKRFPSLGGLEALIRFTGSEMPEKNQDVALETLTFTRPGPGGMGQSNQALSSVPAVLLSECYNDMRLIAAEGRGFDPEWGKLER
jgi:Domain of unknown function (DUF4132)